jgi:uncharacterized protein YndB with AHSA1/START domain
MGSGKAKTAAAAGTVVSVLSIAWLMRDSDRPVSAKAEIDIAAPVKQVWEIEDDIAGWPRWNSSIQTMEVHGAVAPGTPFSWKTGGVSIDSKIREVVPCRRIVWSGSAFGIDAFHAWTFEATEHGTHVTTEETFTGPLAWLLPGTMRQLLVTALQKGVRLLKEESERTTALSQRRRRDDAMSDGSHRFERGG